MLADRLKALREAATPGDVLMYGGFGYADQSGVTHHVTYSQAGNMFRASPAIEALIRVASLLAQWHGAIGSGPIEELDAELGDLAAALTALGSALPGEVEG